MNKPNGIYVLISWFAFNVLKMPKPIVITFFFFRTLSDIDLIYRLCWWRMVYHTINCNIFLMLHQDDSEITELHYYAHLDFKLSLYFRTELVTVSVAERNLQIVTVFSFALCLSSTVHTINFVQRHLNDVRFDYNCSYFIVLFSLLAETKKILVHESKIMKDVVGLIQWFHNVNVEERFRKRESDFGCSSRYGWSVRLNSISVNHS